MLDPTKTLAVILKLHGGNKRNARAYILMPHRTEGAPIWGKLREMVRYW